MRFWEFLRYVVISKTTRPRYQNLSKIIKEEKCRTIMEIGTFDGLHACEMIETACIFYPPEQVTYYGFDLFESLSAADLELEFSKRPPTFDQVKKRLEKTGANIHLYMGYTRDTLPQFLSQSKGRIGQIDFVFIDGGHSIETINLDWKYVEEIMDEKTIVLFDDYYNNDEPQVSGVGCQTLIDSLDRNTYEIVRVRPENVFRKDWGLLRVNMAKVTRKHRQDEGLGH